MEELLPSPDAGPEAHTSREVLLDALEQALEDLPREQRDMFVANELEGAALKSSRLRAGSV